MKTKLVIGVLVAVLLVIIGLYAKRENPDLQPKKEQVPFKVGVMIPLSGEFGPIGEEMRKGAELAVLEAKAKGEAVEMITEDDAYVPQRMASAANKLVSIDKVDAVLTAVATEVATVAKTMNEAKVPLLSAWDSNKQISESGNYIYSVGFNTEAAGELIASYAANNLKIKKVAVVRMQDHWSETLANAFVGKAETLGVDIIMDENTTLDARDYRAEITKAKNLNADAIYYPIASVGLFSKQARDLVYKGKLLTADTLTDAEIAIGGSSVEGVVATVSFADNLGHLVELYKTKYAIDPPMPFFTAVGYDGMNVLLEGNRIAESENIDLSDALKKVKIEGAVGPVDMNGNRYFDRIERLNIVKDGKLIELK